MSEPANPLEPVLQEIMGAFHAQLFFLALMQSLTIPDICGALGTEGGRAGPKQYKAWYEKYVWTKFILLDPDDCYSLRCGIVHQAQMKIPGKQYKRISFFMPIWGAQLRITMADLADTLALNMVDFCEAIDAGARKWFKDEMHNPIVQANIPHLFGPRRISDPMLGHTIITSDI
jgi:hypothetical protein